MTSSTFFKKPDDILNDKDKEFLKKSIAGINKSIRLYEDEYDKEEEVLQQMPPSLSEYDFQIYHQLVYVSAVSRLIHSQNQRLETLKKMQNGQPITFDQQQFLLKIPELNDTIVSRYPLVEEKPSEHKTTCVIL